MEITVVKIIRNYLKDIDLPFNIQIEKNTTRCIVKQWLIRSKKIVDIVCLNYFIDLDLVSQVLLFYNFTLYDLTNI